MLFCNSLAALLALRGACKLQSMRQIPSVMLVCQVSVAIQHYDILQFDYGALRIVSGYLVLTWLDMLGKREERQDLATVIHSSRGCASIDSGR